jgi:signal transduction histidine kinase
MILIEKQFNGLERKRIPVCQPQHLKVIQQLTNLLNQQITYLPTLLKVLAWEVCDAIEGAQFCIILQWDYQKECLEVTATAQTHTNHLHLLKLVELHKDLLHQVFSAGIPQFFPGKTEVEEVYIRQSSGLSSYQEVTEQHRFLPSSMQAVVIASGQAGKQGVLVVGNMQNPHAFDALNLNLLNLIGEMTAIAINNASIVKALEESKQQIARQNEIILEQKCEIERTQQHLQLQQLQLLEATQIKSQFLTTTSHELRTPLNVILGLSQVLLRQRTSTLSEQQVDMVQRILNNGNQLLETINDLLYFTKFENDFVSFQVEEFNVTHLIWTTISEHLCLAEQKHLHLSCHIHLNNHLIVNDSVRLKQVLVKLLLNAIKFTETGSIEVKVEEINSDRIAISVIDTGIGIAESDLEKIFEQFRQVDQTTTRKYGGTGLGLAITKSLVEIMQGTISVTSRLGQGSCFKIELPRTVKSLDSA